MSSFKLRIFNIVAVCLYLAQSSLCNFHNTMPRREPVRMIRKLFQSGNRGEDIIMFVRCVDVREPQIHELWIFCEDGITREVHPLARVDVGDFSRDCFQTYYMTEKSRRVTNFGRMYMKASVKWLGNPIPFYNTVGVPWIDNILGP